MRRRTSEDRREYAGCLMHARDRSQISDGLDASFSAEQRPEDGRISVGLRLGTHVAGCFGGQGSGLTGHAGRPGHGYALQDKSWLGER